MNQDIYTMLPGKVVSYDGKFAVVRPAIPKLLSTGAVLPAPQIVRVAVKFPIADGGKARLTMPMKPGDDVELTFSCRSLENWLSGSEQAPDDPRQFDISDCFCTPVMRPPVAADTDNVVLEYGAGGFKIAPDGQIIIYGPGVTFEAPVTNNKEVTLNQPVALNSNFSSAAGTTTNFTGTLQHEGVNIGRTHAHGGVQTGDGNSGGVVG